MAAMAESAKRPLPPRNRLRQEVEEVEESKAVLWPRWIEEWAVVKL
jgi:hypothetical protein